MRSPVTRRLLVFLPALIAAVATSSAQDLTFSYKTAATGPVNLGNNSNIVAAPTLVGSSSSISLTVQNNSTTTGWSLASATVKGPVFSITSSNPQLGPAMTAVFTITFAPTATGAANDDLTMQFTSGSQTLSMNFFLTGTGLQSNLITSYILNPGGNQVALSNGSPIPFPPSTLNSSVTATVVISNAGTGPGVVNAVSLSGGGFKLSGLPLLPATVQPNSDFRFTVVFTPTARSTFNGLLNIDLGATQLSIPLQGQGVGSTLSYTATMGAVNQVLTPGGTLTLAPTNLGNSTSAVVRVTNSGDSNGNIGSVNVVGSGFSLKDLAPLPATLAPGSSYAFTLVFAPQAAGPASGTLLIDGVSITLNAQGVGSTLLFSSVVGSVVTPITGTSIVTFPNTNLESTTTLSIQIANTGNADAAVSGISLGTGPFATANLPALPMTIPAGGNVQFAIAFTPSAVGPVTATLQIDAFSVTLRGVGNQPPPVGALTFSLPGTANALDQPAVGLSLSQPYPMPLTGKLTLSFTSDSFADDPTIQFASGGRTVNFTIPANSTDAVFGNSKQVQFQAGTVAGVINVSASFAVGSVDVTPSPAPAQTIVVAAAAPQIRNVQIGTRTANSFELLITGLSTPRSVTQLNLQFTPSPGADLVTTNLAINADAPFSTWFQSASGITFGSQFTVSVIVNVAGDINAVQSVSVTAANSRGTSNAGSVNLR